MRRLLLFIFLTFALSRTALANPAELEAKAAELLQDHEGDQALDVLKELTEEYPDYANGHMNYGSILFTKAKFLIQNGSQAESIPIFKEAETYLRNAISLFADEEHNPEKGQCYYLLGDIHFYVYQNFEEARKFYEKALKMFPGHKAAKAELERLNKMKPEKTESPIPPKA